jgi:lipoate-protein ligase A
MFPLSNLFLFSDLSSSRNGELNMAIDETLLQLCPLPWLRLYTWKETTVSIGYFMQQDGVDFGGNPWVRRWTGGGVVTHGSSKETTFTLGLPCQTNTSSLRSANSYHEIHQKIQAVLNGLGIGCHLDQGTADKVTGNSCFENPVTSDVISSSSGSKIVGGAQRRNRQGLLHQGSINGIQLPPEFGLNLARAMSGTVELQQISTLTEDAARKLVKVKYSTSQWKFRK